MAKAAATVTAEPDDEVEVWTLPQLAKELGLHRSTLVRMEQRNLIPKAKWSGPPISGRVFTLADKTEIKRIIERYFREKSEKDGERDMITKPVKAREKDV